MRRFLTDACDLKSVADNAFGPAAVVSTDDASTTNETAVRFVGHIEDLLWPP
jgi:hypothetical protein